MENRSDALEALRAVARQVARSQYLQIAGMLDYRDAEMDRVARIKSSSRRNRARMAVPLRMASGLKTDLPEVQLWLWSGETVRDQAPTVWQAFADGLIDVRRVCDIAHAIGRLQRAESACLLDQLVISNAQVRTADDLRAWLEDFVLSTEGVRVTGWPEVDGI